MTNHDKWVLAGWLTGCAAMAIACILLAPPSPADTCTADTNQCWLANEPAPSGPSPLMSINYLLSEPGYYPPAAGAPGTWQVYATPPDSGIKPTIPCDTVPYQGAPTPHCPPGWDLWYR